MRPLLIALGLSAVTLICDAMGVVVGGGCNAADAGVNPRLLEARVQEPEPSDPDALTAALPVAQSPSAAGQAAFLDAEGGSCRVSLVVAMGAEATCYRGPTGAARCAGRGESRTFGAHFVATAEKDVNRLLVDRGAGEAQPACRVTAGRLACGSRLLGRAGHVVDGGLIASGSHSLTDIVWLEDDGRAYQYTHDAQEGTDSTAWIFSDLPVLAIARSDQTDSVCAVYTDGSLACIGSNSEGKLGTGGSVALEDEAVVLPPGSFDLRCGG